jgi:predicted RNase H-like HicB family nuclease
VVTLAQDEEGIWIAECPALPGCVRQGETRRNALENIADAIRACLEVRQELGMPLGVEVHKVEVAV